MPQNVLWHIGSSKSYLAKEYHLDMGASTRVKQACGDDIENFATKKRVLTV